MHNPEEKLPEMTLMMHVTEFRRRLMYSLLALVLMAGVCYIYVQDLYAFLAQPLMDAMGDGARQKRFIFTGLTEAFFTYIKLSLWGGFFFSLPFIFTQVWLFLAPGLYTQEKRALLPFLLFSPLLFVAGAALAYCVVFPLAWEFFLSFETPAMAGGMAVELEARVNEYLGLVMKLLLAFGICFQLPVLLSLLARVGLVTGEKLARGRKYAVVIILIVAAVMTPPDIISQIMLGVPMYFLYEISIILARRVQKKRVSPE